MSAVDTAEHDTRIEIGTTIRQFQIGVEILCHSDEEITILLNQPSSLDNITEPSN